MMPGSLHNDSLMVLKCLRNSFTFLIQDKNMMTKYSKVVDAMRCQENEVEFRSTISSGLVFHKYVKVICFLKKKADS